MNRTDLYGNLVEELPSSSNLGDGVHYGYVRSKFVAEKLLQQANDRGMHCRVCRLGQVTGDSQTGRQKAENDHLMLEIKGCVQMGAAPDWDMYRNFSAVDVSAKRIVQAALDTDSTEGAFNLVNPRPIVWQSLIHELSDRGYDIKIIPELQWMDRVHRLDKDNALYPFKQGYAVPGGVAGTMVSMKMAFRGKIVTTRAHAILRGLDLRYPSSEELWKKYVDFFERTGFLAPDMRDRKTLF